MLHLKEAREKVNSTYAARPSVISFVNTIYPQNVNVPLIHSTLFHRNETFSFFCSVFFSFVLSFVTNYNGFLNFMPISKYVVGKQEKFVFSFFQFYSFAYSIRFPLISVLLSASFAVPSFGLPQCYFGINPLL